MPKVGATKSVPGLSFGHLINFFDKYQYVQIALFAY